MKKLITLTLLLIVSLSQAQYRQINLIVDPHASIKEGGVNIGVEYETVLSDFYGKIGYTNFSALEPVYHDAYFGGGLSLIQTKQLRAFSGAKFGAILRERYVYPLVGVESGGQIKITKHLSFGAKVSYDMRGDTEFWGEDLKLKWILSGFVFLSVRL